MVNFIILGPKRSGTTVVSHSLYGHPDILLYGELFHESMEHRTNYAARKTLGVPIQLPLNYLSQCIQACNLDESSYEYINKFYSRNVPFKALGFKLLYHSPIGETADRNVWDYIIEHPEIKIIHLQRDNRLEIVCSLLRANALKLWHRPIGHVIEKKRISTDTETMEKFFHDIGDIPVRAQSIFKSHHVLNIEYKQICNDFHGCMSKIFSFLEVNTDMEPGVKVKPKLAKIAQLPPNEELINYQELKEYFKDTQYGKYFIY